jgi:L-threonylcarbamoyladenylate synthase
MSYFTNTIDDQVIGLLRNGGVGLLPSDTIYGLSAVALNQDAVEKIHELKGRDGNKPLIVLIGEISQLNDLGLKSEHSELLNKHWPAPLSVEFDAKNAPVWLHRGGHFFAVRFPNDQNLRNLMKKIGPIVSTSANLQGQEPAKSVQDAKKYFKDKLDFYVDIGKVDGQASTLAKIDNNELVVVREGAYKIIKM